MWLLRGMLLGVFVGVGACASSNSSTARSPAPAEMQWVQAVLPQLGLTFRKPAGWQIVPDSAALSGPPHVDALAGIVLFKSIDEGSTMIVLQRFWKRDRGTDPAELVAELMRANREAARKDGRTIIEDSQRQIAGCPAGIITTDATQADFALRTMNVYFVSPSHEYTLLVAGQADFFDDVHPKVMKLIDSMELTDKKDE